jgi:hypothetical protein
MKKGWKKPSREVIEQAIMKAYGNILQAAKILKVERNTLYAWIKDEGLEKALENGREARIDIAESSLDNRIEKGDTTAIIFFLKTQGRSRGYGQDSAPTQNVTFIEGDA